MQLPYDLKLATMLLLALSNSSIALQQLSVSAVVRSQAITIARLARPATKKMRNMT
jgi:hypothetical protein